MVSFVAKMIEKFPEAHKISRLFPDFSDFSEIHRVFLNWDRNPEVDALISTTNFQFTTNVFV